MIHLRRILARLYGLFVNSSTEAEELEREIAAHLVLMEDDFRSKGMSPQEARRAARRAFGGVEQVKQLHREERTFPLLLQIAQDIRVTLRRLGKTPVFTATAILMLAFGIGATSATFSMVDAILLRPLPFADPSRLVLLGDHLEGTNWGDGSPALVTPPEIQTYIRDTQSFESLGAFAYAPSSCELSMGGTSVMVPASRVTAGVFSTLGVAPTLGRTFAPQEDEQGEQVVVLSHATWKSRFQGSPNVLGAKLLLDRNPYVVIGVMPQTFQFPIAPGALNRTELWIPMSLTRRELEHVDSWRYPMVGRLKPGVTFQRAQNDAERVAQEIMRNYPADMAGTHIDAVIKPLQGTIVESARPLLRILFLAVSVVLLIACANLAGLLLVRALRRQREIAIRLALGTTVSGLLRHILLESIVLSLSGGVLGIAFAALSLNLGKSLLSASLPRIDEIALNWRVVSFALLLSVVTAVLGGLAPAFAAFHTNTNTSLKEGGRGASSGGTHARLRSTLVVVEIAVAMVLLITSGLLMRSFEKMNQVDLGFLPEHVVTGGYWLPQTQYAAQSAVDTFNSELIRNLRRLPGVQSVGLTDMLPVSGDGGLENIVADGYIIPQGEGLSSATPSQVMGDYFSAMGIPLLQGRFFDTGDRADTQLVVIVNHKLAQRYWPNRIH
jgi:predicted permease